MDLPVLLVSNDDQLIVGTPHVEGARVVAEVQDILTGEAADAPAAPPVVEDAPAAPVEPEAATPETPEATEAAES